MKMTLYVTELETQSFTSSDLNLMVPLEVIGVAARVPLLSQTVMPPAWLRQSDCEDGSLRYVSPTSGYH